VPFGIGAAGEVAGFGAAAGVACSANAYSSRLMTNGADNVTAADRFKKRLRLDFEFIGVLAQVPLRPFHWIIRCQVDLLKSIQNEYSNPNRSEREFFRLRWFWHRVAMILKVVTWELVGERLSLSLHAFAALREAFSGYPNCLTQRSPRPRRKRKTPARQRRW
jgi:hypothetical protein